ncbi:hypothetical protein BUALT_Bualt19G0117500 [Buddleja alternifolia]|uniref:Uncharacterized protein n=1 Tax=Buddleja alternifolia TaxID=168488 RepID=A0AAV6W3H6_9LAMI|nr:hypothetical protein BUALT_Bualt19G0117500 [Buddleja alternifolia]
MALRRIYPSILAFGDLISQHVGRVTTAAEKIGGEVLHISKIIVKIKQSQYDILIMLWNRFKSCGVGEGSKELYVPSLRDYLKSLSIGPCMECHTNASSMCPKKRMAAVFQEINSGKAVTSGLRMVSSDMKTKNRAERTGVVTIAEKEGLAGSSSVSKIGLQ